MATLLGGGSVWLWVFLGVWPWYWRSFSFCSGVKGGLAKMAVAAVLCWGGGGGCDGSELEVMRGV
ncbi:hypothetical protein A2U01_0076104, partial [Trifolium medium]|nr:hypothetical protein [Trifolium medium]